MSGSGMRAVLALGILACPVTLFWLWIGMALSAGLNSPMSEAQERLVWIGTGVVALMLVVFLLRAIRGVLPLSLRIGAGVLGTGMGGIGLYLISIDGRNWLVYLSALVLGVCLLVVAAEPPGSEGETR